ncbi:MAG TPA: hypothetical protein VGP36_21370 [Mycobacteriales bacterium]|nr:hypothetical protein [Mycobacteriales bacterium]
MGDVGRPVVADFQPERIEQRPGLGVGQPGQVDVGDRQRVEQRYVRDGAFQSRGLVGEPFRVGAQLGEANVDVADQVAVRVIGQLKRSNEPLAPGGDVVLLSPDARDVLLPPPVV